MEKPWPSHSGLHCVIRGSSCKHPCFSLSLSLSLSLFPSWVSSCFFLSPSLPCPSLSCCCCCCCCSSCWTSSCFSSVWFPGSHSSPSIRTISGIPFIFHFPNKLQLITTGLGFWTYTFKEYQFSSVSFQQIQHCKIYPDVIFYTSVLSKLYLSNNFMRHRSSDR